MKRMAWLCVMTLLCATAALAFSSAESFAAKLSEAKKTAAPAVKKTPAKNAPAKKAAKRKKAASSKTAEPKKTDAPVKQPEIPKAIVDAIASGDLNGAIILMRDEKPNPKLLYLTREAARLTNFRLAKKPARSEAHKFYQNAAISNHNLYLFLKTKGIEQKDYLNRAMDLYAKARRYATVLHKAECDLLKATLLAASGETEKAKKKFRKIDDETLRGDFESMEYLAAYHSAMGDVDGAISALDAAYRLNPDATLTWLAVGDDFANVADDPKFQSLMITWKAREASEKLTLSLPRPEKPHLQMTEDTGLFRPQKALPRYKLKKKASSSKKTSKKRK
ncbi:MAG TPA: hypothetical protein PLZ86_05200 [bacterium]|nr:hypothetical protein [bacterium]